MEVFVSWRGECQQITEQLQSLDYLSLVVMIVLHDNSQWG